MIETIIYIKKKPKLFLTKTISESNAIKQYFANGGTITYLPIGQMTEGITFYQHGKLRNHATKNGKANSQRNCWRPNQ